MAELHVHIDVHIGDQEWSTDHEVEIPPDYEPIDIPPFIRHEIDRAVTIHQREHHEYARSADIIAQYDQRMRIIEKLIQEAPVVVRTSTTALAIIEIMHRNADDLPPDGGLED